jgi:hypothetical protein
MSQKIGILVLTQSAKSLSIARLDKYRPKNQSIENESFTHVYKLNSNYVCSAGDGKLFENFEEIIN